MTTGTQSHRKLPDQLTIHPGQLTGPLCREQFIHQLVATHTPNACVWRCGHDHQLPNVCGIYFVLNDALDWNIPSSYIFFVRNCLHAIYTERVYVHWVHVTSELTVCKFVYVTCCMHTSCYVHTKTQTCVFVCARVLGIGLACANFSTFTVTILILYWYLISYAIDIRDT